MAAVALLAGCGSDKSSIDSSTTASSTAVTGSTETLARAPSTTATPTSSTIPTQDVRVVYVAQGGAWLWAESGERRQLIDGDVAAALPDRVGGLVYQMIPKGQWAADPDPSAVWAARWSWRGVGSPEPILWRPELGEPVVAVEAPADGKVELVDVALADGHTLVAYVRTHYIGVIASAEGENPWWDAAIAELVVKDLFTDAEQVVYEQSVGWEYDALVPSLGDEEVAVVVHPYGGDVPSLLRYRFDGTVVGPARSPSQCASYCEMVADAPPSGPTLAMAVRAGASPGIVVEIVDRRSGSVVTSATLASDGLPRAVDTAGGRALVSVEVPEAIERSSWPTLRRGDEGEWVRVLQQLLPSDEYLMPDGRFGQATEAAVLALQSEYGLPQTGVVGEAEHRLLAGGIGRLDQPVVVEADGSMRTLDVFPTDGVIPVVRWGVGPTVVLWSE